MSIKDGGPAFPIVASDLEYICASGMTLRDWFAGKAMQGIMSDPNGMQPLTNEQLSQWSYSVADAMLKAREEG